MNDTISHAAGEVETKALVPFAGTVAVDNLWGQSPRRVGPTGGGHALGQLPFFTEFLQVGGLFDRWSRAVLFLKQCTSKRVALGACWLPGAAST